ncbi:MAG TPA: heme biosynthesis HemY N-terminal domain-containing protein [Burkholderiaceae bacterium]|nr:heme biosynthesis HemY N-terminal domain-containing protein [Burkholderiaceae bacterium]
MHGIIWLILLFVAAVVAAAFLGDNGALVTLFWPPWRVDISFNFFLIAIVVSILAVYLSLHALGALVSLPRRAREWRMAKRDRSAQQALREALAWFFAGRYSRAYKAAERAMSIQRETPDLAPDQEFSQLAHLLAAGSLHRLQDRARRDEHLATALVPSRGPRLQRPVEEGARLLAAEWALDDRDADRALELLGELSPGVARRTQALRLKLQAARLAQRPVEALRTARLLAKHQAFSPVAAQGLLRSLATEAIESARDVDQLRRLWQQFDAADRKDVFVVARAACHLARMGQAEEARGWLRPFWDDIATRSEEERRELVRALVQALPGIGPDWLPRLESAAIAHPRDVHLAYALGRALAELRLWGKARQLLERCGDDDNLSADDRRAAWLALAQMAEQEGNQTEANRCFRRAAQSA